MNFPSATGMWRYSKCCTSCSSSIWLYFTFSSLVETISLRCYRLLLIWSVTISFFLSRVIQWKQKSQQPYWKLCSVDVSFPALVSVLLFSNALLNGLLAKANQNLTYLVRQTTKQMFSTLFNLIWFQIYRIKNFLSLTGLTGLFFSWWYADQQISWFCKKDTLLVLYNALGYISLTGKSHNCPELRVVLIGGRELGDEASYKSVIGNIILGEKAFEINRRTAQNVMRQQEVHGRHVTVVDTPGWWWHYPRENTPELDKIQIKNCVHLCPRGLTLFFYPFLLA